MLAALALTDAEFTAHMCVPAEALAALEHGAGAPRAPGAPAPPPFYERYVAEVQAKVVENATLEFECLWQEHRRSGTPISILSDQARRMGRES